MATVLLHLTRESMCSLMHNRNSVSGCIFLSSFIEAAAFFRVDAWVPVVERRQRADLNIMRIDILGSDRGVNGDVQTGSGIPYMER